MTILNIAEKPSVAKTISNLLSHTVSVSAPHKYTPNYLFSYNNQQMIFTSILGHLTNLDFHDEYKNWGSNSPRLLFHAEIKKSINSIPIKQNLLSLSRSVSKVILWTDCDREGENIANEVRELILQVYPSLTIKRASFHAITLSTIRYALENLGNVNMHESDAVDTRIELDLRLGSAFTRLQSLKFGNGEVISYGPCQIPTLRFIVERMRCIDEFLPEKFYGLSLILDKEDEFGWVRNRIFDENLVIHMYNALIEIKTGIIESVEAKRTEKLRPLPLRTVEFQKACASIFKISAHRVMQIAENLYNKGFISYPRTETDSFPNNFDFKEICNSLTEYSEYVTKLNNNYCSPRRGNSNDGAHLPIYPLKSGSGLDIEEKKIYDYVARRYLASISKNAIGIETEVIARIGNEKFKIVSLKVIERNYLEIFTFDKWNEKKINEYKKNDKINVNWAYKDLRHNGKLKITEGTTTPPDYITEPELISLMDKNGIGTDATIAEHIHKIVTRKYAYKSGIHFLATGLGYGLICGYEEIGLENFTLPLLRSELESNLKKISENQIRKKPVLENEIETYLKYYDIIENKIDVLEAKVKDWIGKTVVKETKKRKSNKIEEKVKQKKENVKNIETRDCNCKIKAKLNKVAREGENKGREFWGCGNYPTGCNYFEWVEKVLIEKVRLCQCGYEVQKKTANTDQNKGRDFLYCKKAHKPCKFFEWCN